MFPLFRARAGKTLTGLRGRPTLSTTFRRFEPSPLEEQEEAAYATHRVGRSFAIEARKANLFCWSLVPEERIRDVVLVADLAFGPANGHSAMGFILRYLDEASFYYFLISTRGAYRFDLALNGNHIPLIEWTRSPLVSKEANHLRIVLRGAYFGFCLEEEWIAEIEDDRIESGRVGFAAQNFDESPRARFAMTSLLIDTAPREVERAYERWARTLPVDPASRFRLAETLAAMGGTEAAIVQLNKALRDRVGTADEYCLLARLLLALRLYPQALEAVDRALAATPEQAEALVEKAEILYAMNRLTECRDFAAAAARRGGGVAPLVMVLGNAEYALGNWREAADAYLAAWDREHAPLAAVNAARSFDRKGEGRRALELYVSAAEAYYRQESLGELDVLLAEMEKRHADRPEVRSLRARLAYWRGEGEEAERLLAGLVAEGAEDSAVHFLYGLILSSRGDREGGMRRFDRAVELEPEAAVYWFRLAETRHLLGLDAASPLAEALRLEPDDPWANNLSGLLLAEAGNLEAAEEALTRAAVSSPGAAEIALNLSDVLHRRGRSAEALVLLEGAIARMPDSHLLVNQRGNILAASGDVAAAHAEYEKALRMSPGNRDYLENCARVCIELDLVSRAEECLRRLLEDRPTASVYGLMGNVAAIQLQYDRAEAALREGLRLDERNVDLLYNLTSLFVARGSYGDASTTLAQLLRTAAGNPEAELKASRVQEAVRSRFEEEIRCAGCSRRWWVPRELPSQPPLRARGDPPDDAPVGSCPECGAVYCAGCAREHAVDGRFVCATCGSTLSIADARLVYLFRASVERAKGGER